MARNGSFFNRNIYLPIIDAPKRALGLILGGTVGLLSWYTASLSGAVIAPYMIPLFMATGGLFGYAAGGRVAERNRSTSTDLESPFYTDPFYKDYSLEEKMTFESLALNARIEWDVIWISFNLASDTLKLAYENQIETLKKGLHHRLLRIHANGRDLHIISEELRNVLKIENIHDRFEEMARICDLLVLRRSIDDDIIPPTAERAQGLNSFNTQAAARGFSQAGAQAGAGSNQQAQANSQSWEPGADQWQEWQQAQMKGIFATLAWFFEILARSKFFANRAERERSYRKQERAAQPPRFTEVGNFVIVEHHNPYAILGVSQSASSAEIAKAYRKVMRDWHPDRNQANLELATQETQRINRAKEFLDNPAKRQEVDVLLGARSNDSGYRSASSSRPGFSYASNSTNSSNTHSHTQAPQDQNRQAQYW